jgi:REP element-mobilizing transposase RayT
MRSEAALSAADRGLSQSAARGQTRGLKNFTLTSLAERCALGQLPVQKGLVDNLGVATRRIPILNLDVPEIPPRRTSGPPHNPGVRELVSAKRLWSSQPRNDAAKRGFRGWNERGYLPHRDAPGLVQFVTFRLADSFPAALRSEWAGTLQLEDDRERRRRLEAYLDRGCGECFLRRPDIAALVEQALRFHHPRHYELSAWVIMPNHLHCLIKIGDTPLAKVLKELKRYTGREANKILGRRGAFWYDDYFDTYMRDNDHELRTRHYIENNPTKAKLVLDPKAWPWSSARLRDDFGTLHL